MHITNGNKKDALDAFIKAIKLAEGKIYLILIEIYKLIKCRESGSPAFL